MHTSNLGSHWSQGQQLSKQVTAELLNAAHRQFNTRSANQAVSVLPFGTNIDAPRGPEFGHGAEMFSRSFLARITLPPIPDEPGPPPPDFSDERYWVRETLIADPTETKTFEVPRYKEVSYERPKHVDGDKLKFDTPPTPPAIDMTPPRRVTVATNIAEIDSGTHALGVPANDPDGVGQFVLCHTFSGWNGSQFTFFDTAAAQATEFVIVVGIILEPVFAIRVRPVLFNPLTAKVVYSGDPIAVWPWPNTPVTYYQRYVWNGDPDDTSPVLRAQQIGGQWHVEQNLRHRLPVYPTDQRFADCAPPSFELPDNAVGACCQAPLGACTVMSQVQCEEAGGTYVGDGSTCNVVDCCSVVECTDEVGPQP